MYHVIAIGNWSAGLLDGLSHEKIKIITFRDYREFLSCRLTLRTIDAFLVNATTDLKLIHDLRAIYRETVILTLTPDLSSELTLSFLQAGASDVVYEPLNRNDILHRLLSRLIQSHIRQQLEEANRPRDAAAASILSAPLSLSS